jgi:hypothetical protein
MVFVNICISVSGVAPRLGFIGFARASWVSVEPNTTRLPTEESSGIIALKDNIIYPAHLNIALSSNMARDWMLICLLHQAFTGI